MAARSGRRRLLTARRCVALGGALLVAAAAAAACTAHSSSSNASSSSSSSSSSSDTAAAAAPAAGTASAGSAAATTAPGAKTPGQDIALQPSARSVIRVATVAVRVDVATTGRGADADADAQAAAVTRVADNVRALTGPDGYEQSSSGSGAAITVVLRVAPSTYASVFTALGNLGTITSRTDKADDVTGQLVDLDSRMKTMKASVDRVRLLLAKADKIGDIVAIESELTQRESDLESLESQQAALSGQVALSTITVQISSRLTGVAAPTPPAPTATGFVAGLEGGWHALKAFVEVALQILGAVLPFTPIALVVVVAAVWIRRRQRRAIPPTRALPGAE